jgi:hypothetical protein
MYVRAAQRSLFLSSTKEGKEMCIGWLFRESCRTTSSKRRIIITVSIVDCAVVRLDIVMTVEAYI